MKYFPGCFQLFIVLILLSNSAAGQDKLSLKLPLGLSPDITPDSAKTILLLRGWGARNSSIDSLGSGTYNFDKDDFSIGELEFEYATLGFRELKLGRVTFDAYGIPYDDINKCCQFLRETYNIPCLACQAPQKLGLWEQSTITECENKKYKLQMGADYSVDSWSAHITFGTISFLKWEKAEQAQLFKQWEIEDKQKIEKSKDDLK